MLTTEQRRRYSRTILLEGVGNAGQERLCRSTVAVAGAGALGSTAAMYLAGSGTGHLRLIDFDTVDLSNLQRQLTYSTADLGAPKVERLARRIAALNPDVDVAAHNSLLTAGTVDGFIAGADLVIEGSDNPATKYLVTDAAARAGIPCILGAVGPDSAQLMTLANTPVETVCENGCRPAPVNRYRSIFPEAPAPDGYTPCSLGGLPGPLPGVVATMQALAAINHLLGRRALTDAIIVIDPLTLAAQRIAL